MSSKTSDPTLVEHSLPAGLSEQLTSEAARNGVSVAELLQRFLDSNQQRPPIRAPQADEAPSPVPVAPKPTLETSLGKIYQGDSRNLLRTLADESVDLIVTSPPFGLLRPKSYGNEDADAYWDWFRPFAREFKRVLKEHGSLVIDIGGTWNQGLPTRSLYHFELVINLCRELDFHLCLEHYWWNPAKLPTPAEWVNIRRCRVKDAVNTVWWLSKSPWPKSSNTRVLSPYSGSMKKLLSDGYRAKLRPSGHDITQKFSWDNGGAIPPNLLAAANTSSNDGYLRYCASKGLAAHDARFPAALPEYFIQMLTDPGDLVVDPFAGSCSTGAVAERLGREWRCFELNEAFLEGARGRFIEVGGGGRKRGGSKTKPFNLYPPCTLPLPDDCRLPPDGGQSRYRHFFTARRLSESVLHVGGPPEGNLSPLVQYSHVADLFIYISPSSQLVDLQTQQLRLQEALAELSPRLREGGLNLLSSKEIDACLTGVMSGVRSEAPQAESVLTTRLFQFQRILDNGVTGRAAKSLSRRVRVLAVFGDATSAFNQLYEPRRVCPAWITVSDLGAEAMVRNAIQCSTDTTERHGGNLPMLVLPANTQQRIGDLKEWNGRIKQWRSTPGEAAPKFYTVLVGPNHPQATSPMQEVKLKKAGENRLFLRTRPLQTKLRLGTNRDVFTHVFATTQDIDAWPTARATRSSEAPGGTTPSNGPEFVELPDGLSFRETIALLEATHFTEESRIALVAPTLMPDAGALMKHAFQEWFQQRTDEPVEVVAFLADDLIASELRGL